MRLAILPFVVLLAPATARADPWDVPVGHSLGVMTGMRTVEALLWPEPFADGPIEWGGRYHQALTEPPLFDERQPAFEWDHDPWPVNVVGHALFGSELYFRARACGHGVGAAILFGAAMGATWEYAFEGSGVRPSGLDLVYTPLSGMIVGEARLHAWRAAAHIPYRVPRIIVRVLFDPLGELERAFGLPC